MSSLSRRLALLRKTGGSLNVSHSGGNSPDESSFRTSPPGRHSPGESPNRKSSPGRRPPGEGWINIADGAWERNIDYPPMLPEVFERPFVLPREFRANELAFYDLETTGLSGGSGNIAFLIGFGVQKSEKFTVTQLFLSDYPGEAALIKRYAELIQANQPQVSYNGRSFDSQVLKVRFLLNRMPPRIPEQIDLLYPSRRLWKGVLPNLSLGTLEREVLGFFREDDLPGREAPDAWFEWLKGDEKRIGGVFTHNADDIVSLARLLVHLEEWGGLDPGGPGVPGNRENPGGLHPSHRGMARQWAIKNPWMERRWLEAGWGKGRRECGWELALKLKREGNFPGAVKIWNKLNGGGSHFPSAVELAKYYEHRLKNPGRALDVLQGLKTLPLNPTHRRELSHRRRRLTWKLQRLEEKKQS